MTLFRMVVFVAAWPLLAAGQFHWRRSAGLARRYGYSPNAGFQQQVGTSADPQLAAGSGGGNSVSAEP